MLLLPPPHHLWPAIALPANIQMNKSVWLNSTVSQTQLLFFFFFLWRNVCCQLVCLLISLTNSTPSQTEQILTPKSTKRKIFKHKKSKLFWTEEYKRSQLPSVPSWALLDMLSVLYIHTTSEDSLLEEKVWFSQSGSYLQFGHPSCFFLWKHLTQQFHCGAPSVYTRWIYLKNGLK